MGFKCGIVGLPNVGKSTLFNALTETAAAQAANYPFCTIEPNVGEVAVPDPRLDKLSAIAKSARVSGTVVLEATIGPDGKVIDTRVIKSVPLLDQAAIDAVQQWEYTPTMQKGASVPVVMTITVNFTLK